MTREQIIIQTVGANRREYLVVYEDDSPERAEAVKSSGRTQTVFFPGWSFLRKLTISP